MVTAGGAVVVVLGKAVADDKQHFQRGAAGGEFRGRVAHRRPHARGALRLHGGDGVDGSAIERLVELLGDGELHAIAPVAGEAVHGVAVPQPLEGGRHQHGGLAFDVDDPAFGGVGGQPRLEVRIRVVKERVADVLDAGAGRGRGVRFHHIVRGGRQIHQQRRGDVPTQALPAAVEALVGGDAGAQVHPRLDHGVQIQFVAVGRLLHPLVAGRPHLLEAPPHPSGVGADGAQQRGAIRLARLGPGLEQPAPAAQVDGACVIPFVVAVAALPGAFIAEAAAHLGAFHVQAALLAIALGAERGKVDVGIAQFAGRAFGGEGGYFLGAGGQRERFNAAIDFGQLFIPVVQPRFPLQQLDGCAGGRVVGVGRRPGGKGRAASDGCGGAGVHVRAGSQRRERKVAKGLTAGAELRERGVQVRGGFPLSVTPRPRVAAADRQPHAGRFDGVEHAPGEGRGREPGEEHPQRRGVAIAHWPSRQGWNPGARRGHVETVGAELPEPQLIEHQQPIDAGVALGVAAARHLLGQIQAASVVGRVRNVSGRRRRQFAQGLHMVWAGGDSLREERERALDVH